MDKKLILLTNREHWSFDVSKQDQHKFTDIDDLSIYVKISELRSSIGGD